METLTSDSIKGSPLSRAIAETLAYADLFDYPLTAQQIHRYLAHVTATLAQVEEALTAEPWLTSHVERHGDLYCLRGRAEIIPLHETRQAYARSLWRTGRTLARLVAHLPFVRMVAMIGSLTMDNPRAADDDIDLFIVTAPGRVWLTRALVILLVRLAALRGHDLCPNYLLSTRRLTIPGNDIFTAHELAQLLPLHGRETFQALLAANRWLADYLPNAAPQDGQAHDISGLGRMVQRLAELILGGRLGDSLERRIRARKLAQLQQQAKSTGSEETLLDEEMCKGHLDAHGREIRRRYAQRLEALGLTAEE